MYNTKKGEKNKPKTAVMYDTKNTIHNIVFSLYIGSWIYKTVLHKKLLIFNFFLIFWLTSRVLHCHK